MTAASMADYEANQAANDQENERERHFAGAAALPTSASL